MTSPLSSATHTSQLPADRLRRFALMALLIVAAVLAALAARSLVGSDYRTPMWAIWVHLATVVPAVPLGAWLLWRARKGDLAHRIGGRMWAVMMLVTAVDSFWIRAVTGTIGPIHIFSVIVLVQIPRAILLARAGQIDRHLKMMRGVYFGLIAAGLLAMAPGRTLWSLVFG